MNNDEAIKMLELYRSTACDTCRAKIPCCEFNKCKLLTAIGIAIDKLKEEKAVDNLMRAAIDTNKRAQREKKGGDFFDKFESMLDNIFEKVAAEEEKRKFQQLKDEGIIGEVVLFANPEHAGELGYFLHASKIKANVIYTSLVDVGTILATTDKSFVDNVEETTKYYGG